MKDNAIDESEKKSTNQLLDKIPDRPGLYRHSVNRTYYGRKKIGGKRKEKSLETTDRAIAERRLKEWVENLAKIDREFEKTTLEELFEQFKATRAGKPKHTLATDAGIVKRLKETWHLAPDVQVSSIKVSDCARWLSAMGKGLKPASYNRYAAYLVQLFKMAVADRIIAKSPLESQTTWKRPVRKKPTIPTREQFQAIVANIRQQRFNADAHDSADFIEFLGLAGLGQAEADSLTWEAVDFEAGTLSLVRKKTNENFTVPMDAALKPWMERLRGRAVSSAGLTGKVFQISDGKRALNAACQRLAFPHFSQRNLRQMKIVALLRAGVSAKTVAEWQGHQDGGKLILDTYSEVLSANDAAYQQSELAKYAAFLSPIR